MDWFLADQVASKCLRSQVCLTAGLFLYVGKHTGTWHLVLIENLKICINILNMRQKKKNKD